MGGVPATAGSVVEVIPETRNTFGPATGAGGVVAATVGEGAAGVVAAGSVTSGDGG